VRWKNDGDYRVGYEQQRLQWDNVKGSPGDHDPWDKERRSYSGIHQEESFETSDYQSSV
jgi:hypothetical protein